MATDIKEIDGSTLEGAAQIFRDTLEPPENTEDTSEAPDKAAETTESETDEGEGDHEEASLETTDDLDTAPAEEVLEEAGEGEQGDYVPPTLEPPMAWTGDEGADWNQLPDSMKNAVIRRDRDSDRGIAKRLSELAETEKGLKAKSDEADRLAAESRQRLESLVSTSEELTLPDLAMLDADSDSYDPDKYHLQKAGHDRNLERKTKQQRELLRQRQEDQKKYDTAMAESKQDSAQRLLARFPSWKDPDKGRKAISDIQTYMVEQGVPRETAASVHDATIITAFWKARQFDRARAGGKEKVTPKVTRPATRKASSGTSELIEATKALKENPNDLKANARVLKARRLAK